jgi:hypothetical protein
MHASRAAVPALGNQEKQRSPFAASFQQLLMAQAPRIDRNPAQS